jgi:hypothetical protein
MPLELREFVPSMACIPLTEFSDFPGVSMPKALRGRPALSSLRHEVKVSSASSSDSQTCAFSHFARSRALNDSMRALPVGCPGQLKSSLTSSR